MLKLKMIRLIDNVITQVKQRNKDGGMYVYYSNILYYTPAKILIAILVLLRVTSRLHI